MSLLERISERQDATLCVFLLKNRDGVPRIICNWINMSSLGQTALSLSPESGMPSLSGGLSGYLRMVRSIPMLSEEEERESALSYRKHSDASSGKKLILSHLRLAVAVARNYRNYGLPEEDLIQEGNVGLFKALRRYDPDRGARFSTFALYWIKAEIQEFIIRNWRIVKIATTKAQRKLFFNLRRKLKDFGEGRLSHGDAAKIADDLDVKKEDVFTMKHRMSSPDIPYETLETGDDDETYSPANYLTDGSEDIGTVIAEEDARQGRHKLLYEALDKLDNRSRDIICSRWLNEDEGKSTLHVMAEKYGVSAERIRQIEASAMKRIKDHLVVPTRA